MNGQSNSKIWDLRTKYLNHNIRSFFKKLLSQTHIMSWHQLAEEHGFETQLLRALTDEESHCKQGKLYHIHIYG